MCRLVLTPFRNPIIIAALAGIAVSLPGVPLWSPLTDAIHLVAGMAVPAMRVIAALPAAQNIFTHASRYRVGVDQARETILFTTVLAPVALIVVAALLG